MLILRKQLSLFSTEVSILQNLYNESKIQKTPFFTVPSHKIKIIDDPLDFYMQIQVTFVKNLETLQKFSL